MKINKCCETCEYNYNSTCVNYENPYGYGWIIDDYSKLRSCWESSFNYSKELLENLPENEKNMYSYSHKYGVSDLVKRLETGHW
ncbi:hypothetical protein [Clostridium sp. DJ247]|uniref:hypothetical protein n=1 Tax=Clostridium sp. DJ247 TaxID=2726188 RepID=UPI0016299462|nr:hypothetical protein [Clostridium sp. DJ247]MBC2581483.1 hypothetical protein [Clostridium sp. DJ247]